jgi:hypothetical protein
MLIATIKLRGSFWLALKHDLSKFTPTEWNAYVKTFYDEKGKKRYEEHSDFKYAWNHHQKFNPHHWQYWLLKQDDGQLLALKMPEKYVYEMCCDWLAAGRVINGRWEYKEWWEKNRAKIILHPDTLKLVEYILGRIIIQEKLSHNYIKRMS